MSWFNLKTVAGKVSPLQSFSCMYRISNLTIYEIFFFSSEEREKFFIFYSWILNDTGLFLNVEACNQGNVK